MKKIIYCWVMLFVLVACQNDGIAEPMATEMPAATPSSEATPTPLPQATDTPQPPPPPTTEPIATPSPIPTIPIGTITVTPSPIPTTLPPTPEPIALLSPADFGDERSPLTGQIATDPDNLLRRPLTIKISNAPARWVRPQSGLSQADLVFEHIAEGATRFTAVVHSQTPPDIGPIRSARLIDLDLPEMYDAALVYSGASIGVASLLNDVDFRARILRSNAEGYYRTGADKPTEHTLHADPIGLWNALEERGENVPPQFPNFMPFSELPPAGGTETVNVTIEHKNENTIVHWEWDNDSEKWLRWTDGDPHLDANTDEQLTANNVVILYVVHELDRNICEFQAETSCLAFSWAVQFWRDTGPAVLLRDGQRYEGTWQRFGQEWMIDLVDESGTTLPYQLGNTFFQVIPPFYDEFVTFE